MTHENLVRATRCTEKEGKDKKQTTYLQQFNVKSKHKILVSANKNSIAWFLAEFMNPSLFTRATTSTAHMATRQLNHAFYWAMLHQFICVFC